VNHLRSPVWVSLDSLAHVLAHHLPAEAEGRPCDLSGGLAGPRNTIQTEVSRKSEQSADHWTTTQ
jgi:hypothetical protein